jgi:DNA-binding HxlR family transcriptional regulator
VEPEPKELIVLGAIKNGITKFDKIKKTTQIEAKELNSILENLEKKKFITVLEKKGWFGTKIEIIATEKGINEVEQRVHELKEKWNQMSQTKIKTIHG